MTAKPNLSRRTFLKAIAISSVTGALAACAAPAATKAPQAAAPVANAPTPTEAPQTQSLAGKAGVLWGLKYEPHVAAYQRLVALFQKKTDVTMKVEPQEWPIETKVITALSAGTSPDNICIMGQRLLPLHLQKALVPLREVVYRANSVDPDKDFIGDAIGAYTWQNDIWGVPVESNQAGNCTNIPVEDVKKLGLDGTYPPTNGKIFFDSHEHLWDLAKALQQKDSSDKITRWGMQSGWDPAIYLGLVRSQGVDWWDKDARKFNADSEAGVKAVEWLYEKPVKLGVETQMDANCVDNMLANKIGIAVGNPGPSMQARALGFDFELAGTPKINGKEPLYIGEGGWGFVAPKAGKNQDMSIAFLQMMCTEEGQKEYAKIYDGVAGLAWKGLAGQTDYFADPSPTSANVKANKIFSEYLVPRTAYYGEEFGYVSGVTEGIAAVGAEVRQGKWTAAEGAKQIQTRLEAQYKQYLDDIKKLG